MKDQWQVTTTIQAISDMSLITDAWINTYQSGPVTGVSMTLNGLDHTFLLDLDVLLVSPDGRKLMVISDIGGGGDANDSVITFSDAAAQAFPTTVTDSLLEDGTYRPATRDPSETLADFMLHGAAINHADGTGAVGFASTFHGGQSAGRWALHVRDDAANDTGRLESWSLSLTTADTMLGLTGTNSNDFILVQSTGPGSGRVVQQSGTTNPYFTTFSGVSGFTLYGGPSDDVLMGGDGTDVLYGGSSADQLYGGAANDQLRVRTDEPGEDRVLDGGAGTGDILRLDYYASPGETIDLRKANISGLEQLTLFHVSTDIRHVVLTAAQLKGFTSLNGSEAQGNDQIDVRMRAEVTLDLGALVIANMNQSYDYFRVRGDANSEVIFGSAGRDIFNGNGGNDRLAGGAGDDSLDGGAGNDWLDYTLSGAGVQVRLWNNTAAGGDAQGDAFTGVENLFGSGFGDVLSGDVGANSLLAFGGDDYLSGREGADLLDGGTGNDILVGGAGADSLIGGTGRDTADYTFSAAVTVRLWNNTASGGEAAGDTFSGVENVTGSAFGDVLSGSDADGNTILGGGGADFLYGRAGADRLDGGTGNDSLYGGTEADQFVFAAGYGQDRVDAFQDGLDKIDLVGLTFASFTETAIAGGVRLTRIGAPTDILDLMGVTTAQIDAGDFI